MNIFYYSVHHILEDDEIRLFQNLGHNVFCLGINNRYGASQGFRPPITFNEREHHIYNNYEAQGGKYFGGRNKDEILPYGFVNNFSVSIIMHDVGFLISQWDKLRTRPAIWRTIGQGVEDFEILLRDLRNDGLKIVRYSETERMIKDSLGQEDIIRFCKSAEQYRGWTGDEPTILTFSNFFEQRYPKEAADFKTIVAGLPCILAGGNNETFSQAIGFVDCKEQVRLYRSSRVYLYANGLTIPYTLNFIEAWITGTPVVVYAPFDRTDKFFEIDRLVEHGRTGYICRDIESARFHIIELLQDQRLARRISEAGRKEAIRLFGPEKIGNQWQALFDNLT